MSSEQFRGKRVLVVGLGRSGIAAAKKLCALGADVCGADLRAAPAFQKEIERLEHLGARIELGEHKLDVLQDRELIVTSPGVPDDIPLLAEARKRDIPVWSEIELAYRLTSLPMIAVTGTNGKTTTVAMITHILNLAGRPALAAGNIGNPLTAAIDQAAAGEILVVEVSSFQLEHVVSFAPRVAVLLNISDDHFDRHKSLDQYTQAKARLFENQSREGVAVINRDDANAWALADRTKGKLVPFSAGTQLQEGVSVSGGEIIDMAGHVVSRVEHLKVKGRHNLENALAAVAVCRAVGLSPEAVGEGLAKFEGLPHRLEYVTAVDGIEFYNDSKATNPDATVSALASFDKPIILLAGGRNKGMDLSVLKEPVRRHVKLLILVGEAADEMERVVGAREVARAASLEVAVQQAFGAATPGDVVLLSPACASFDMFENYEERGRAFKDAIAKWRMKNEE